MNVQNKKEWEVASESDKSGTQTASSIIIEK